MRTRIIAHRGLNGIYPENTPRSFEEALKLDIDGIECDVNLSRDGHLMVIHDQHVDRTSNGSGAVADLDLAELKQLNIGSADDPQEIMLLSELIDLVDAYPGKHLFIETKHPSPYGARLEEAVAEALTAAGYHTDPRFHLISFNPDAIQRFQRLLPELETFLLITPLPMLNGEQPAPFEPIGASGVGPSIMHVQAEPDVLAQAERSYVWTVNLPKDMLWCQDRGVDFLATDLPHIAAEVLHGET